MKVKLRKETRYADDARYQGQFLSDILSDNLTDTFRWETIF